MALSRLGCFIELVDIRNRDNEFSVDSLKGISINKVLTPTKANTNNLNLKSYKILKHNWFTYSLVTSRNGNKISLAYNDGEDCIVSSINPVFKVKDETKLLPRYLMMFFNRPEFDRYARFNSWGSARETFSWDDFCNIELNIPSIEIQKKYVAIYEAMLDNLKAYKNGGDDLSLVCNGYIEKLMKSSRFSKLSNLISRVSRKNINGCKNVMGVCSDGIFMKTKANMTNINLANYTLVQPNEFAYNPSRINLGSIAICEKECIVSPMYEVFLIKDTSVLHPLYLHFLLTRPEFLRSTLFYAVGSVRDTFDFDLLAQTEIPLPSYQIQTKIVAIYGQISKRRNVASNLEALTKELCPILVKGAVLEAEAKNQ